MRENLRSARLANKMTQKQVAEYLKITLTAYQYIESGKRVGRVELWDMLEDLFNVHQRVLRENHPDKPDNQG